MNPVYRQGAGSRWLYRIFHGLQGIPWLAETIALSKQILMTEETGIHAHFSQITIAPR